MLRMDDVLFKPLSWALLLKNNITPPVSAQLPKDVTATE